MTLVKRNSDRMFPSFFDHFFGRDWMDWNNNNFSITNTTVPAVNVMEDENNYIIEVAAPGMRKSDFSISLDKDQLIISSQKKEEKETQEENYSRKEFSYQSFQRSFRLPENLVDGDKIKAKYDDGILMLMLPKKEEIKPQPIRTIKIS